VVAAVQVARFTMRKVKQNLGWAFGYNTLSIPLGAGLLYPSRRRSSARSWQPS
jgi:Cu+-exporting ATPase